MRNGLSVTLLIVVVTVSAIAVETPSHHPTFTLEEIVQTRSPGQFVLSPDRSMAVFTYTGRYFGHPLFPHFGNDCNLFLVTLATGERRQLTHGTEAKTYPAWSPDGKSIAYESEGDIWSVDVETGEESRLSTTAMVTSRGTPDHDPAWSPDGSRVAFVSNRWGRPAIYIMDRRGERVALSQVTPDGFGAAKPVWSPDGTFLLFISRRGTGFYSQEIYSVPAAGGIPTRLTPDDNAFDDLPSFSPDGHSVAYISDRSGFQNIWTMRPDGTEQHQLTRVDQDQDYPENDYLQTMGLHWSPDGKRILYFTNRVGNLDLMVVNVASGQATLIDGTDGEHHPVGWTSDDSVAYVYENYRIPPDLYVRSLTGRPKQVTFSDHVAFAQGSFDKLEAVSWKSEDGVVVHGFLRIPSPSVANEKLPAIVMSHTYNVGEFYNQWNPIFDYIVQSGYVMLMVDHRGSNGFGTAFRDLPKGDWGLGQVKDILSGEDWLKHRPEVDSSRVGMMGYSMGGYLTLLTVMTHPSAFKAAVDVFGLGQLVADPEHDSKNYTWHLGSTSAENPAEYNKRSPITYAAQLQAPLLIIGSDGDPIEPVFKTYNLIQALDANKKVYEAYVYKNEQHGLKDLDHQLDSYQRVMAFLDRYLKH